MKITTTLQNQAKRIAGIGICAISFLAPAGCDTLEEGHVSPSVSIRPAVTSVVLTKAVADDDAGECIASIPLSDSQGDTFFLTVYEKDMPDGFCREVATKGLELISDSLKSFKIKAYAEDDWHDDQTGEDHTKGEYFAATEVSKGTLGWDMSTERKWLNAVPLSFWSWNEVEPAVVTANGLDKASFSYTLATTVTSQKDIVFAYNKESRTIDGSGTITDKTSSNPDYTRTDDELDIHFYHALSAIRFDISGVEDDTVDNITIGGVASGGDCNVTVSTGGVPEFAWGNLGTAGTYSQAFSASDFNADGSQKTGGIKEFLMIPQTLTDAATITVTFSGTASSPKSIKGSGVEWKAGKYYTYKLSKSGLPGDFTFSLASTSSPNQTFTNTTGTGEVTLQVDSKRQYGTTTNWDWEIKSYKIGSSAAVEVNGTSFTDKGGVSAVKDGNNLKITASARTSSSVGTNSYWKGNNGAWSPESWSDSKASSDAPLDLSKLNFQSETTNNAMTTANCYIIRHAGSYKIPLVYGNGIVNGAFNEQAYKPTIASGGSNGLTPFLHHLGKNMTSPFIEYNKTGGTSGTNLAPAVGTIVWQDTDEIITIDKIEKEDVTVKNASGVSQTFSVSYLYFTIPQDKICQNNAIIAVKDGTGSTAKIMWSWHIWTTNDPALLDEPISVFNKSNPSVEYKFFPLYMLGWHDDSTYPSRDRVVITLAQKNTSNTVEIIVDQPAVTNGASAGVYYEFGRKDPFPANDPTGFSKSGSQTTIANAICTPGTYYHITDKNWCSSTYYNLWTGKMSSASLVDQSNNLIKTVYDPSPVGYKLPASNAFTGFTSNGSEQTTAKNFNVKGSFANGWNFYTKPGGQGGTIFFPASGSRTPKSSGGVADKGSNCLYWTAVIHDANHGKDLSYKNSGTKMDPVDNSTASYGYCVRPVKE